MCSLLIVCGIGAGTAAEASTYKITATFECPYYILPGGEWDLEFRPENRQLAPCGGLHVTAKQPGFFGDSYCGEDYTAWDGTISLRASTDCVGDVYLSVDASSLQGFSVGTHDFPFWKAALDAWEAYVTVGLTIPGDVYDFLVANKTFEWESASQSVDVGTGETVDFGAFAIGAPDDDHNSKTAADVFPVASLAMKFIEYSGHLPDNPAVTINHPVFGTPTTIWKTVLFKDSDAQDPSKYPRMLRSIAHEFGHATYNRYHSGQGHWLTDARYYLANHYVCEPLDTLRFGWYEGFADFTESIVYTQALKLEDGLEQTEVPAADPFYHVFRGCYWDSYRHDDANDSPTCSAPAVGFNHEGNVQALLDQIYLGQYRAAFHSGSDASSPTPIAGTIARGAHRPGRDQFTLVALPDSTLRAFALPSLAEMFGWIEAAGADSHTARELLDGQITPWCQAGGPLAPRYCSSATFQNELAFLDATATAPPSCTAPVEPVGETSGTALAPHVQLEFVDDQGSPATAIHFGAVHPGQIKTASLALVNTGSDAASVDALYLSTSDTLVSLVDPPPLPIQLGPGESVPVTVALSPGNAPAEDVSGYLFAVSTLIEGLSLPGGAAEVQLDGSVTSSALCAQVSVSSLAGNGQMATVDGTGANASFAGALGVAVAANGDAFVCEGDGVIRRVTATGEVTTLTTAAAHAAEIAVDAGGTLYATTSVLAGADSDCGVLTIDAAGAVRRLAGSGCGFADGAGAAAQFFFLGGIAVAANGTVYVADSSNHRIRAITPAGVTTTLAGNSSQGSTDGTGAAASFDSPFGLALLGTTLYVTDYGAGNVRQIDTTTGAVTTRLPSSALPARTGLAAIAVTPSGALLFTTNGGDTLDRLLPGSSTVELLAGGTSRTPDLFADGDGCTARFDDLEGLAVNGQELVMTDHHNLRVRELVLP